MKHIRKVLAVGLVIVFFIALVIGAGVIFSVKNVNVSYIDYSSEHTDEYERCRESLKKIKGSSLIFFGEGDVLDKIVCEDVIAVESYEKVYPCTVNIVLKERVETFVLATGNGYDLYDEDGVLIKETESFTLPSNAVDACPDIIVTGAAQADMPQVAALCKLFSTYFGSGRRLLEKVEIKNGMGLDVATLRFRSNFIISVGSWKELQEQKIKKASELYSTLTDSQKVLRKIVVLGDDKMPVSAQDYLRNDGD